MNAEGKCFIFNAKPAKAPATVQEEEEDGHLSDADTSMFM